MHLIPRSAATTAPFGGFGLKPANLGMCDEEVASCGAQAHTGVGVAVQPARRLCAVRLQLGCG